MTDYLALAERLEEGGDSVAYYQTVREAAAALREAHADKQIMLIQGVEMKALRAEGERLIQRNKEHEQFRHQHRDCESMGTEITRLRALLREARGYVVGDHGWDYENGGWLADRIDAELKP